jgi:hypothetical protein
LRRGPVVKKTGNDVGGITVKHPAVANRVSSFCGCQFDKTAFGMKGPA